MDNNSRLSWKIQRGKRESTIFVTTGNRKKTNNFDGHVYLY